MKSTFLDTSFLIALLRERDEYHRRARLWQQRIRTPLVTTEYVLLEFGDACSSPTLRRRCADYIRLLRKRPIVRIILASREILDAGLSFFEARPDKHWGLTDCISFQIMQEQMIADALSSDRHFEQAGFRALLRHEPDEVNR